MRPSSLPEMFDVQLSDAPVAVLADYPVILPVGDIGYDSFFILALEKALQGGSQLLLSECQRNALGKRSLARLIECGDVVMLESWINPRTKRPAAISSERLKIIAAKHFPILIEGDPVLSQINRKKSGWVLEIVNNDGVTKFPTKPVAIDHSAVAHVTLKPSLPFSKIVEWRSGRQLALVDQAISLKIGPGKTVFWNLQNNQSKKKKWKPCYRQDKRD